MIDFNPDVDGPIGIAISSYLIVFGLVGLLFQYLGILGLLLALLVGYLVTAVVIKFVKWALSGQSEGGSFFIGDLVGEEVQVIGNIREGRLGEGLVRTPSGTANYAIQEEKGLDLKANDRVIVVTTRGNVLIVKKKGG